ncbi:site-specific DNA-methyltransferase [uncultured Desulfovibrio sp.]|nr:site-specific DNA-methyltransferase [uncultured Desulfovibrio sp.]
MPKQRLELTWIGKDVRPKLEPRILLEDPARSYHAPHRVSDKDIFDNMLIHGDNLLALKALEQEFTGKVKCIYIDPPYNTGSAFEHYDDGVEHSLWLSLMRDRLELLRGLLAEDGSLWVNLDDNEAHYFKVMCDEVFGRKNFVANVIWQKKFAPQNDAKLIDADHDHILIFGKDSTKTSFNLLPRTEAMDARYKNPDNDPRGPWASGDSLRKEFREYAYYEITTPSGRKVLPPPGSSWRFNKEELPGLTAENRLWFGADGNGVPRIKRFLSDVKQGIIPQTVWLHSQVGHTQDAKKEIIRINAESIFDTPKPEKLIQRILEIATNPGDLVLDSFLGSGTTAAVAHKMGRRWIGIELGEHCYTHCIPRLQKVINGEDPGGITKAQNWQGGGGFRFYELAPSLIKLDPWDIPVINPAFNAEMLAEAVCKLHGYRYAPCVDWFWMHGEGHKNSYIFVTTQTLTTEILQFISDQVGESRSLLICCPPCPEANAKLFPNISLSIMPNALLKRYEWDHDDYSLNVKNLPQVEPQPSAPAERAGRTARGKKAEASGQVSLLDFPKGGAE